MSDSRFADSDRSTAVDPLGKSPFAPGSPFPEYYRPPPLGIIHLLAWTAATAVLLRLSMAMEMIRGDRIPQGLAIFRQVVYFIYSTAHAAGFVGACVLLLAKIRRLPGRLQPGHWLLLIAALMSLLSLSIEALDILAGAAGFDGYSVLTWYLAGLGLVEILCAGLYLYATLKSKQGKRWRVCFASLAVVNSIQGLLYLGASLLDTPASLTFSPFWSLIVGPVLLVTVVLDLRRGPRRDWLHWLGVAILATGVAVSVAWWVWSIFAIRLME